MSACDDGWAGRAIARGLTGALVGLLVAAPTLVRRACEARETDAAHVSSSAAHRSPVESPRIPPELMDGVPVDERQLAFPVLPWRGQGSCAFSGTSELFFRCRSSQVVSAIDLSTAQSLPAESVIRDVDRDSPRAGRVPRLVGRSHADRRGVDPVDLRSRARLSRRSNGGAGAAADGRHRRALTRPRDRRARSTRSADVARTSPHHSPALGDGGRSAGVDVAGRREAPQERRRAALVRHPTRKGWRDAGGAALHGPPGRVRDVLSSLGVHRPALAPTMSRGRYAPHV